MSENIQDPFGPVAVYAIALHSLYGALRDAGFTEEQAMKLIAASLQYTLALAAKTREERDHGTE